MGKPPGTTEPQGESTRRAILTFLKVHGGSEVKGIAEFCGLTAMAVRRHLLNFLANGLLQTRTQRRPQGRPVKIYFLTELGDAQFPRDYAGFASDLLSTLVVLDGEAKVKKVFRRRRSSMMIRYKARVKGKSVEERVCETAAILTECGYMAEAAPSESRAFSLTERHCQMFPRCLRGGTVLHPGSCRREGDTSHSPARRRPPLLLPDRGE